MNRLRALLRPERGRLLLAAACMVVLSATTALAASLVGPTVQALVFGAGGAGGGGAANGFAARLLPAGWLVSPLGLPGLILATAVVKGLAYFGQFHLMARAGQRTAMRLRQALLRAVLAAPPEALARQQTGELLTRFSRDATAVEMAVTYALGGYLRDTLTALLLLVLCLVIDWRLTLLACAALPLAVLPLRRLLRRVRSRLKRASEGTGALGHLVAEGLQGLPSIQVDGLEEREAERFHRQSRAVLGHQLAAARTRALLGPLTEIAAAAGLCLALAVAATSVAHGALRGDQLISFLAAALLLSQPVKALGKVGHFVTAGQVALARIDALLGTLGTAAPAGTRAAPPLARELTLSRVRFRYRPDGPWALDDVSLTVQRGEQVAIVGESGAGKSTLFQLLLGLRTAESGEARWDGEPFAALDPASRFRHLAWMGQDPFVFDGTFAENIALDVAADESRLRAAATRAQALPFIERAGGFAAQVGERGRRLSGGERQRLCIARALYQDAPLLLLDEPTSHLDPESDAALQLALRELLPGRTALVIAHRLSTVRSCGRALVFERGRLVEDGPPGALLASGGPFARLFGARGPGQPHLLAG